MVHHLQPLYRVPGRNTFRDQIIPTWHTAEKQQLLAQLALTKYVGLTGDLWTSRATDPYITCTAHFVENFKLKTKVLCTEIVHGSHTGANLAVELDGILVIWDIVTKVVAMTVDNAVNMTKALQVSGVPIRVPCFAHTLNLASCKGEEIAHKVLARIRQVVAFFHKSHVGHQVLQEKQQALSIAQHDLIIDCKTRWNSTYLMVERYMEQRIAILATLTDDRLSGKESRSLQKDCVEDSQITQLSEYLQVMKPMYTVSYRLY